MQENETESTSNVIADLSSGEVEVAKDAPEPTEAELMAELEAAMKTKDFKVVAAVSRKLDTAVKSKEKAELDVKRAQAGAVEDEVKAAYIKAFKPLIDSGKLDAYDGITEYGMEVKWTEHNNGYMPDRQVKVYLEELDITSDGAT